MERVETVIIGAGQAGLSMSYHLGRLGLEHLVLERGRIAERWRSERWDSLTFQFPNWMLRLPGYAYEGDEPEGFMQRDRVVHFIEAYAKRISPPIRCGVRVRTAALAIGTSAGRDRLLHHGSAQRRGGDRAVPEAGGAAVQQCAPVDDLPGHSQLATSVRSNFPRATCWSSARAARAVRSRKISCRAAAAFTVGGTSPARSSTLSRPGLRMVAGEDRRLRSGGGPLPLPSAASDRR